MTQPGRLQRASWGDRGICKLSNGGRETYWAQRDSEPKGGLGYLVVAMDENQQSCPAQLPKTCAPFVQSTTRQASDAEAVGELTESEFPELPYEVLELRAGSSVPRQWQSSTLRLHNDFVVGPLSSASTTTRQGLMITISQVFTLQSLGLSWPALDPSLARGCKWYGDFLESLWKGHAGLSMKVPWYWVHICVFVSGKGMRL